MARDIFKRYRELAQKAGVAGTRNSMDWFRNRIRKDKQIRDLKVVTERLRNSRIEPGAMVTYEYDPKTKDKLPFYDSFPLIFILGPAKGGWYGINLHYLPPVIRAELMIEIGYKKNSLNNLVKALENNPNTAPALKRYLTKHMRSPMKRIPREDWEIAINLPTENFQKATNKQVWNNSKRKLR